MDFIAVFEYWPLLLRGLGTTLLLSAIVIVGGVALGLVVGIGLTSRRAWLRGFLKSYSALLRGSPLLVQLFMLYLGLNYLGINLPVYVAAAVGLIAYAGAYIGEILRSGLEALPVGQFEAAASVGFTGFQILRRVAVPQTMQMVLPALASFCVSLIKDTSIASIIGFADLLRETQAIVSFTKAPFEAYFVVAVMYFLICFPLSRFFSQLERKRAHK